MNKKQVLNAVLSFAVIICLFALVNSITKMVYGIPVSIIIITFIGVKIKELKDWAEKKK